MKRGDKSVDTGGRFGDPDPLLLWVLARLLYGLPIDREIGRLPEPWQDG